LGGKRSKSVAERAAACHSEQKKCYLLWSGMSLLRIKLVSECELILILRISAFCRRRDDFYCMYLFEARLALGTFISLFCSFAFVLWRGACSWKIHEEAVIEIFGYIFHLSRTPSKNAHTKNGSLGLLKCKFFKKEIEFADRNTFIRGTRKLFINCWNSFFACQKPESVNVLLKGHCLYFIIWLLFINLPKMSQNCVHKICFKGVKWKLLNWAGNWYCCKTRNLQKNWFNIFCGPNTETIYGEWLLLFQL